MDCRYFRRRTHPSDAKEGDSYDPYDFTNTEEEMPQGERAAPTGKKVVWVSWLFNALCYAFACGFPFSSLLGALCPRIQETRSFGNKLCLLVYLLSAPCSLPSLARASQIPWAGGLLPDQSLCSSCFGWPHVSPRVAGSAGGEGPLGPWTWLHLVVFCSL